MLLYAKWPFWLLFKYNDAFYLWILGDCTKFRISFLSIYISLFLSLGFLRAIWISCHFSAVIVATLRCSFASSPFPYSLCRNIRARHRNMFRRGRRRGLRGGRREIARWIFAAGGEFRFFFPCFQFSAYLPRTVVSHTVYVRSIFPRFRYVRLRPLSEIPYYLQCRKR